MYTSTLPFVLASASPRRSDLMARLGIEPTILPSSVEEPPPGPDDTPEGYAAAMAEAKARDVAAGRPDAVVLGADTVVALGGRILGKPDDAAHAVAMLTALSGRTHQVVTGCCLLGPDGRRESFSVSTEVDMRRSTEAELAAYVATGEPMDKAGAYAIQGAGAFLVTAIRGSYTNVVGLPLARVLEVLVSWGVIVLRQG